MAHTVYYTVTVDSDSRQVVNSYCPTCHCHCQWHKADIADYNNVQCPHCHYRLTLVGQPRKPKASKADTTDSLLPMQAVYDELAWLLPATGYTVAALSMLSFATQHRLLESALIAAWQRAGKHGCIISRCDHAVPECPAYHTLDAHLQMLQTYLWPYVLEERRAPVPMSSRDMKGWNATGQAQLATGIGYRPARDAVSKAANESAIKPTWVLEGTAPLANGAMAFVRVKLGIGVEYMLNFNVPSTRAKLSRRQKRNARKAGKLIEVKQNQQQAITEYVNTWLVARGYSV